MWTLGKLAALAASVERATNQREAARRLSERISLVQQIHERVIQRLFGLLLALGSEEELTTEQRAMCHDEVREVLHELRDGARAARSRRPTTHGTSSVRRITERVSATRRASPSTGRRGSRCPRARAAGAVGAAGGAAQRREARSGRRRSTITLDSTDEAFVLEVVNDGAGAIGDGDRARPAAGVARGAPARRHRRVRADAAGPLARATAGPAAMSEDARERRAAHPRAGRRRPRRRPVGLPPAARAPALGRALPGRARRRRGARARRAAKPARRARRPVPRQASRAPRSASELRAASPEDQDAADLRRRQDLAGGRSRRRRLGLRLQGLGRAGRRQGGADGRRSGWTCSSPRPTALRTDALGARARGGEPDRLRARPTARSPSELYLSPHTVKEHTSALYRKLGVRNRAEAVRRAQRLGLIA